MIQIKHKKILILSGFLVTIAICVAMVFGAQKLLKTWRAGFGTSYPQKTLDVNIGLSQREKFFEQLTRFADAHDFKIHIGPTTPSGDTFNINMSRKDVIVIANNVVDTKTFHIAFYDEDPANSAPEEGIDRLYNDLKSFINEIPNVLITEKRKGLTITIDESQREELFARLQQLADKHSLKFELTLSSDRSLFQAEIHGDGLHITSEPLVGSPETVVIDFYVDYHQVPTSTSLETVDELFNELKSLLGEIPNVTITEEK
ncbi:MAG TPA: hypothetical protein VJ785_04400 [Anaerolineales bacterium]|nr:hypothetical protein [Anaerolineales bacterium]